MKIRDNDLVPAVIAISFAFTGLFLAGYLGGGLGVIAALLYGAGAISAADIRKRMIADHSTFLPSQN